MYDKNAKRDEFKSKHVSGNWFGIGSGEHNSKSAVLPRASYLKVYSPAYSFQQSMQRVGFLDYSTRIRIWASPINAIRWCAPRTSEEITLYGVFYIGLSNELRVYVHDKGLICAYVKDDKNADWNTPIEDDCYLVDELLASPSARKRILFEASNGDGLRKALFEKLCGTTLAFDLNAEHLAFAMMGLTIGVDDMSRAQRFCTNASRYGFCVTGYLLNAVMRRAHGDLHIVNYDV